MIAIAVVALVCVVAIAVRYLKSIASTLAFILFELRNLASKDR